MEKCLADIQSWMIDERLLINDDKTEVLYCDSSQDFDAKGESTYATRLHFKTKNSLAKNSLFLGTVSGNKLIFFLQFSAKGR